MIHNAHVDLLFFLVFLIFFSTFLLSSHTVCAKVCQVGSWEKGPLRSSFNPNYHKEYKYLEWCFSRTNSKKSHFHINLLFLDLPAIVTYFNATSSRSLPHLKARSNLSCLWASVGILLHLPNMPCAGSPNTSMWTCPSSPPHLPFLGQEPNPIHPCSLCSTQNGASNEVRARQVCHKWAK